MYGARDVALVRQRYYLNLVPLMYQASRLQLLA